MERGYSSLSSADSEGAGLEYVFPESDGDSDHEHVHDEGDAIALSLDFDKSLCSKIYTTKNQTLFGHLGIRIKDHLVDLCRTFGLL